MEDKKSILKTCKEIDSLETILNFEDIEIPIKKYVILFKSSDIDNTPYQNLGKDFGVAISVIFVMDYEFINSNYLKEALHSPDCYKGLIFTSPRAVTAVERALNGTPEKTSYLKKWCEKLNFAIAETTKSFAASRLGIQTIGQKSGNSENLLNTIISTNDQISDKSFLYPCSEIRKDTLPQGLRDGGIGIEEIKSYRPVRNNILKYWHQVQQAIQKLKILQGIEKTEQILVFFSPSSVKFVLDELKPLGFQIADYQVIAFGPSTAKELIENYKVKVIICDEPSPAGLRKAIESIS